MSALSSVLKRLGPKGEALLSKLGLIEEELVKKSMGKGFPTVGADGKVSGMMLDASGPEFFSLAPNGKRLTDAGKAATIGTAAGATTLAGLGLHSLLKDDDDFYGAPTGREMGLKPGYSNAEYRRALKKLGPRPKE